MTTHHRGTPRHDTPAASGALPIIETAGRHIDNWDPENTEQWDGGGKVIAKRNLRWSIFAEFLGFVVWQLWSIVVVLLPAAGFTFDISQIFWLISIPSLVGATLRFPYSFLVPKFGGRNWTIISAGLLLIPAIALGVRGRQPGDPVPGLLLVAALAGFGGGNFASSMSNITYFYPQREKGWALGLNAAGGNLGASVAQFVVPIVITIGAGATRSTSPLAGLDLGAAHPARDVRRLPLHGQPLERQGRLRRLGRRAARTAPVDAVPALHRHFRLVHRLRQRVPQAHRRPVPDSRASRSERRRLARLPRRAGRLPRPPVRRQARRPLRRRDGHDRRLRGHGRWARSRSCWTLPLGNFWLFLGCFLLLFAATGVGNGSTYRMIPSVFAARDGVANAHSGRRRHHPAQGRRRARPHLGDRRLRRVPDPAGARPVAGQTGSYASAFFGFVAAYVVLMAHHRVLLPPPRTRPGRRTASGPMHRRRAQQGRRQRTARTARCSAR